MWFMQIAKNNDAICVFPILFRISISDICDSQYTEAVFQRTLAAIRSFSI